MKNEGHKKKRGTKNEYLIFPHMKNEGLGTAAEI